MESINSHSPLSLLCNCSVWFIHNPGTHFKAHPTVYIGNVVLRERNNINDNFHYSMCRLIHWSRRILQAVCFQGRGGYKLIVSAPIECFLLYLSCIKYI